MIRASAFSHFAPQRPRQRMNRLMPLLVCSAVVPAMIGMPDAGAHHLDHTLATVMFDRDGRYDIDLHFHVAAYVLRAEPGILTARVRRQVAGMSDAELGELAAQAAARLRRDLRIEHDAARVRPEIQFPDVTELRRDALADEPQPSPPVRIRHQFASSSHEFSIVLPARLGKVVLELHSHGAPTTVQILRPGERSWPYPVRRNLAQPSRDPTSTFEQFTKTSLAYLQLGFEHILPKGLDHILFVVGLFLLNQGWRPLLAQVTAFTIAHSISLALSIYHVVSLPASIVEPLIAVSIAYVAIENIFTTEPKPWRPAVIFAFGLLHGLGFAGVLRTLGLPAENAVPALIGFNVGVEIGQIAVLGIAFLTVGWFRGRAWYRPVIVIPASCLIALTGVYWTATRLLENVAVARLLDG